MSPSCLGKTFFCCCYVRWMILIVKITLVYYLAQPSKIFQDIKIIHPCQKKVDIISICNSILRVFRHIALLKSCFDWHYIDNLMPTSQLQIYVDITTTTFFDRISNHPKQILIKKNKKKGEGMTLSFVSFLLVFFTKGTKVQ